METIFNDIQQKIKTDVPEIKWIDIDENQLEAFGENSPVDYPCVLVGFPDAQYSDIGYNQQIGEITVTLKVAFRVYERLNTAVPTLLHTQAFSHFAILKKLMKAIHTLKGKEYYSALIRKNWRKTTSIDPKVYLVSYQCAIKDKAIAPQTVPLLSPAAEITVSY